jgi:putative phosphoribosyl transferase
LSHPLAFPGDTPISIDSGQATLHGLLTLPAQLSGVVVLAHAGRQPEARDDALAVVLQHAGFGTLTLDLLTPAEERFADIQHNVSLLARRLLDGLTRLRQRMLVGELPTLPIGLCASGDASPVALRVAAVRDHDIFAVVCRGGLIDLAGMLYLRSLSSPLLVLVAADDERVAASNRRALRELGCDKELQLLPASGERPDAAADLAFVARATVHWFVRHLTQAPAAA